MEPTFATHYFYFAAGHSLPPGRHTCAICGLPTAETTPLGSVLRPTFTDLAYLRRPPPGVACPACDYYMSHQELRRANWWLTAGEAQPIERRDLRRLLADHLAQPPAAGGYYLITTSKRKHLALRAPLNLAGAPTRRVQFELATLTLDAALWSTLTAACDALRHFHTWQEILNDTYQSWRLVKWPRAADFIAARAAIQPYARTPYLELVKFVSVADRDTKEDTTDTDDTD